MADGNSITNPTVTALRSSNSCSLLENLKVLSWNINDSSNGKEGRKTGDADFTRIITSCAIFCLQETKGEIFIPDYRCFNSTRKGTRSGGLCIGVHKSLSNHVMALKTESPDIQAVVISLDIDGEIHKLTVVNVYDSPDHSSYKVKKRKMEETVPTLDTLLEFTLNGLQKSELIFLAGDFNARTASSNFIDEHEDLTGTDHPSSHPCNSNRSSKDCTLNARGKLLLDYLACANLSILNGCTLGDVLGEFTSVNYNGCSVVDYVATNTGLRKSVKNFRVLDLTKYSDHKPCLTTLGIKNHFQAGNVLLESLEDAPSRHKWPNEEEMDFKFMFSMSGPPFNERICTLTKKKCTGEKEVLEMNSELVSIYQEVADEVMPRRTKKPSHLTTSKKRGNRMKPKSPWFDSSCINAKRSLNTLAKKYGRSPHLKLLRDTYFDMRRSYRKLIKKKREDFIETLCRDIEEGRNVNWKTFKSLKKHHSTANSLDAFDMMNFCNFFKKLYGNTTLHPDQVKQLQAQMEKDAIKEELTQILDKEITIEELTHCVKMSKKGKAVSEDLIANEFLKASTKNMLHAILNLFNQCLLFGVYPWTTSLVTPLHKKGCLYDPNNYRAIAVASNLGKTFSSILLQRLITFRSVTDPDTANQLGFCQGAQTSDHIFTLTTCIEKYVTKGRRRLYSCFVDYAKAFDSVCREALLFKMWKMGIQGRFFRCIQFMYSKSSAKVKLLNKLSEKIDIICGTEQGHPMSPELFKCFIHQLSLDINALGDIEVPQLNSERITHLLWADDLVLLALDGTSLQMMLDVLGTYCIDWGLSVNVSKTAVLVFNTSGRLLKESHAFKLGEKRIPSAREYCYLGIHFTLSGSLKVAQNKLRQKGLRSYFSLKRMINLHHIRKNILFKLFDALLQPVVAYACQVWLPSTGLFKLFGRDHKSTDTTKTIALDPLEKIHLSLLKWTMGVNKYTSNAAVWGDCGRYPLGVELSKLVFSYRERLELMDSNHTDCLVRHAYYEQKALQLSWYTSMDAVKIALEADQPHPLKRPSQIRSAMRSWFRERWDCDRANNNKLRFYNEIKNDFHEEKYLRLDLSASSSRAISRLRTSSHKYNVETGRYGTKRVNILNRVCKHCSTDDEESLNSLLQLPFAEPVIEDELHVLRSCPLYDDLRSKLSPLTKNYLSSEVDALFEESATIRELGRFLNKVDKIRFHKKKDAE